MRCKSRCTNEVHFEENGDLKISPVFYFETREWVVTFVVEGEDEYDRRLATFPCRSSACSSFARTNQDPNFDVAGYL